MNKFIEVLRFLFTHADFHHIMECYDEHVQTRPVTFNEMNMNKKKRIDKQRGNDKRSLVETRPEDTAIVRQLFDYTAEWGYFGR